MNDNMSPKLITVWLWYHDEPALNILCKVNAKSNKLLEKFEPHGSFRVPVSAIDYDNLF